MRKARCNLLMVSHVIYLVVVMVKASIKQTKHMTYTSLTIWMTRRERAQMVRLPILIVGQLMEVEVSHSAARKFSTGDPLYSSLRRSAMQSLVLFLTFVVSYFQEQWGLLSFPFMTRRPTKSQFLKKIGKKSLTLSRSGPKSPYGCVKLTV